MCTVTYRRIAMAINLATFLESFVDCCLFACCPGGRWGNTEQVVTQCQRSVASGVALDMTHWAIPSVLLGASIRPSKRSATEVHFDVIINFVIDKIS
jgi:hypothetical protein